MNRIITCVFFVIAFGCHSASINEVVWTPDTTHHSTYTFVDDNSNFIDEPLLLRMYDATFGLGGYSLDSTVNLTKNVIKYDRLKEVSDLFLQLKMKNRKLCQQLLAGKINALDTTIRNNHSLVTFIPIVYKELTADIINKDTVKK